MGSQTSRLKLYKVNPATDPISVEQDHNSNFDILDDHAPIRTRPSGSFPGVGESYTGGMVYQTNGKIYSLWNDGQYRPLKQKPSFVYTIGNTGASIPTVTDTYLNWGFSQVKDGMDFLSSGAIRFKKTGLYYVSCAFNISGTAGNYERLLAIMIRNGADEKYRLHQNKTQGNVARCSVGGMVKIGAAEIGWEAAAFIFQNSGSTVVYNDTQAFFGCTRLGGYSGD